VRSQEAEWVGKVLSSQKADEISPVLELGTTSRTFREITKPHIAKYIHQRLEHRGVTIVTSDLFGADGVDIAGDIFDKDVQRRLGAVGAKTVMVCNIFEHVVDVAGFAQICDSLLAPGGLMIVTVPFDYPYHLDPIDTLYRPTPEEVITLFPGYNVLNAEIIASDTHADDIRKSNQNVALSATRDLVRSFLLRGGKQRSLARLDRLRWLFRRYRVTCIAMSKP
jgi:hypothetical protein